MKRSKSNIITLTGFIKNSLDAGIQDESMSISIVVKIDIELMWNKL